MTAAHPTRRQFIGTGIGAVVAASAVAGPVRGQFGATGAVANIGPWVGFTTIVVPSGIELVHSSGFDTSGIGAALYALDPDQSDTAPTRFRRKSADLRWFRIAEAAIGFTMAGARGDGVGGVRADGTVIPDGGSDDTSAIQALYDYLAERGGGTALVERQQFNVGTIRVSGGGIRTVGQGPASHVHTIHWDGRPSAFVAEGAGPGARLSGLEWENLRISGGAAWRGSPFEFNGRLCGYGIRTRWADDVRVRGCFFDHLSNSGVSVRDGERPLVRANTIHHVAQGIDIFFRCVDALVIGNIVRDIRVFVGLNVEGRRGEGHPRGTVVAGNMIDGAITSGIDVIEAGGTVVSGNKVANIIGNHPQYPGYSFGIQAFGSPGTLVTGNHVSNVGGAMAVAGRGRTTGIGISIAANSSDSEVVGNIVRDCSRGAILVNDTHGTAVTTNVLIEGNSIDTDIIMEGNVSLRDGRKAHR